MTTTAVLVGGLLILSLGCVIVPGEEDQRREDLTRIRVRTLERLHELAPDLERRVVQEIAGVDRCTIYFSLRNAVVLVTMAGPAADANRIGEQVLRIVSTGSGMPPETITVRLSAASGPDESP